MLKKNFTETLTFKAIFYSYCLLLILEFIYHFISSIGYQQFLENFQNFTISDWLINYQAGFIRRGLWGEIFFNLYNIGGVNIGYLIYFLSYAFLFIFLYIFIRQWKKFELSLFILPSVCLIGAFATLPLLEYRRDILTFLLIWIIFINYKAFINGNKARILCIYIFSIINILSHEASFFYFVPIMGLHYLYFLKKTNNWKVSITKGLLFLLPILLIMVLCVIEKGNSTMANTIWKSWDKYFISEFGKILPIGGGCEALGWDGIETFKMHFRINYLWKFYGIRRIFLWPIIFLSIYYLLIHVNHIKIGTNINNKENFNILYFSQILILQFIFLLPMFTILSCDFRRVVLYWTLSSFLFYFALGKKLITILKINFFSMWVLSINKLLFNKALSNNYVFFTIYIFLGIPYTGFKFWDTFYSSVLGHIYFMINLIKTFIYEL